MPANLKRDPRPTDQIGDRRLSSPVDARLPFDYAAWLLDLDGTLYHQQPVRLAMALELAAFGRSSIGLLKEFRREHERLHHEELPLGFNPFNEQLYRAAQTCGVNVESASRTIDEWMIERPGKWLRRFRRKRLLAKVAKFRAQGGKTAVVSDYPAGRKLAAMGIDKLFDVVVASGEPGGPHQLKPHPTGLLLAMNRLEMGPRDCLVIGDRSDADGAAAQNAGMQFQHIASRWPS